MSAISIPSIVPPAVPRLSAAPGIVRVDVHLERGRIADDEQRVAELLELALEPVDVEPLTLDHEHGAVAELRELLVHRLDARA